MIRVSDRIKEALELRGLSQSDIVTRTGIPKASISQYVSGYVEPKQDRLYLIAKALNVQEAWLLGYDVPMDRLPEQDEQIIRKVQQLSPQDKEMVNAIIDRILKGDENNEN